MDTLKEADYVSVREEFRKACYRFYGVSPIIQGDLSGGGGMNNEGLQFKVTDRAVQMGQSVWNTVEHSPGMFEDLLSELRITDYILELPVPEEDDKMAPLTRMAQKLTIIQQARDLGLSVTLPDDGLTDDTDPIITGDVQTLEEQQDIIAEQAAASAGGGGGRAGGGAGSGESEDGSGDDDQHHEGGRWKSVEECMQFHMGEMRQKNPDWSQAKLQSEAKFVCRHAQSGGKPKTPKGPEKPATGEVVPGSDVDTEKSRMVLVPMTPV